MGYAFISYSTQNQALADAMRSLFLKNNIDTWMAPYDIPAGCEYAEVLFDSLMGCSCLVLMLTEDSQSSVWVKKEVNIAISNGKAVIPLKLEDIELNSSMKLYLNDKQIVPVHTIDEKTPEIQKVLSSVIAHTGTNKKEKAEEADKAEEKLSAEIKKEPTAEEKTSHEPNKSISEKIIQQQENDSLTADSESKSAEPKASVFAGKTTQETEEQKKIEAELKENFFDVSEIIESFISERGGKINSLYLKRDLSEKKIKEITSKVAPSAKEEDIVAYLSCSLGSKEKSGILFAKNKIYWNYIGNRVFFYNEICGIEQDEETENYSLILKYGKPVRLYCNNNKVVFKLLKVIAEKTRLLPLEKNKKAIMEAVVSSNKILSSGEYYFRENLFDSQRERILQRHEGEVRAEDIVAFFDDSLLGNGKRGVLITKYYLYDDSAKDRKKRLRLDVLSDVLKEKNQLTFVFKDGSERIGKFVNSSACDAIYSFLKFYIKLK